MVAETTLVRDTLQEALHQFFGFDNFKDSVDDERLHGLYADFWSLHRRYQEEDRRPDRCRHLAWDKGDLERL